VLRAYVGAQRGMRPRSQWRRRLQYAQNSGSSGQTPDGFCGRRTLPRGGSESLRSADRAKRALPSGHRRGAYRGYRFRILARQGAAAPGGAYSYVINGRMIAVFAMVAYPDDYGTGGVMTFVVNQNGKVYEKDFGESTADVGAKMLTFNPGAGWKEVTP
jgi:hypothetical protein